MKPAGSLTPFQVASAYVLNITSAPDGARFAAAGASTDGKPHLVLVDSSTLKPVANLAQHSATISDLKYAADSTLLSSSMDGTVAVWDLRTGRPNALLSRPAPEPEEDTKARRRKPMKMPPVCSVDSDAGRNMIAYGTGIPDGGEDSMICFWDPRSLSAPVATFADSHSEDITCIRFRPERGAQAELASAGTDGVLNLFHLGSDIFSNRSDEDKENDAIQMTIPLESVARFDWASKYIWALTTTERLFVVEPNEGDVLLNIDDIRAKTGSEYLIDCVYEPMSERLYLYAGLGGNVRCFHVNLDGVTEIPERNLFGGHADIVRGFAPISRNGQAGILTGGEDGRIIAWV